MNINKKINILKEEMPPLDFKYVIDSDYIAINLHFQDKKIGRVVFQKYFENHLAETDEFIDLWSSGYQSENFWMCSGSYIEREYHGKGFGKLLYNKAFQEIIKMDGNAYVFAAEAVFSEEIKSYHSINDLRYTSLQAQKVWASLGRKYPSSGMIIFLGEKQRMNKVEKFEPTKEKFLTLLDNDLYKSRKFNNFNDYILEMESSCDFIDEESIILLKKEYKKYINMINKGE